jgi:hypothetical protein
MTRDEQLTYCKKCLRRKMDATQGLVCTLTGQRATFQDECADFEIDETVKEKPSDDQLVYSNDEVSAQLPRDLFEQLKLEQDLPAGVLAGISFGLIGAFLWSIISISTGYQIGYMAIAVGLGVGFGIRRYGKGIDPVFGVIGASIALFSCLLGNFFAFIGIIAGIHGLGFFETLLRFDYSQVTTLMKETFQPIDLLFYGTALYTGFRFSFRTYTSKDIEALKIRYYKKA